MVKFNQSFEQPSPGLFSYGYITLKSSNAFLSSISMTSFISVGNTKKDTRYKSPKMNEQIRMNANIE